MSKLVHLLKERLNTNNVINTVDVKKETSVGVLFRLMVLLNNDHTFYNDVKLKSFVSKNLGDLEDKQTVKNLNMIFNKLMSLLKDNKRITIEMKKAYYSHVFTLLLPFTNPSDKFIFGYLIAAFSSNKPDDIEKQRTLSKKIGLSILNFNEKIDMDDKFTIQAYIRGLDEIEGSSDETQTASSEIAPKTSFEEKITKMTTEEIEKAYEKLENEAIVIKNDTLLDTVGADIIQRRAELDDKLVDAHTFARIKMDQIEAPAEVESKIIEITDKIVDTITKLPITHLSEDKVKRIQKISAMISSDTMSVMVQHVPDIIGPDTIPLVSFDPDSNSVIVGFENPHGLRFVREFRLDKDGNITSVYHEYFELPESAQGTGISKDAMLSMLKTYKAAGIEKVDLHANLGMGGYVFLRYGFLPDDKSGNDIKDAFKGLRVGIENGLNPNKQAIGTTATQSLNALLKHFNNDHLSSLVKAALYNYEIIKTEVKNFLDAIDYDPSDDYGGANNPVIIQTISEYIAEMFDYLIKDVESKFEINYETLDFDIATKSVKATIRIPTVKLTVKKINYRYDAVKSSFIKKVDEVNKTTGSVTFDVSVKTILTIPGIIQTTDKGQMVNAFPTVETEVNGEYLVSALNWKGSLDLTNPVQFSKAITYATFKK